ncbi:hypothetical protein Nepgr_002632 [Nepenthes gracilis]|uniref:Uncharacterized protein n=1 Tax=Nepenthes gracilis TaxID=150966 RepID=A0AAD3P7B9_NEPGR|nr:hypothetical protein Nepgr_002632 [Nepenthes gracilis]
MDLEGFAVQYAFGVVGQVPSSGALIWSWTAAEGAVPWWWKVDVNEPLPCHSSSDQIPMPVVVQADPPLHCGPTAIGYSSRPPDSSTPPGPGSPSRCSESSNSLKISLGRSSSEPGMSGPINNPPLVTSGSTGHHSWFATS